MVDYLAWLAPHVGQLCHRGRRFAFNFSFKGFGRDVGNANGGLALVFGYSCSCRRLLLGREGTLPIHVLIIAPPIELLQQFTAAANSPRLNAVGMKAQGNVPTTQLCCILGRD